MAFSAVQLASVCYALWVQTTPRRVISGVDS
jgi:hypothetical protein